MSIPALSAAKTMCEHSGWSLSNLALQKLLYIAHMYYLGNYDGAPLINEDFEAWAYGPVLPSVYHKAKVFGADPVKNVFHGIPDCPEGAERQILVDAVDKLATLKPAKLVNITHWDNGAWAKHFESGSFNNVIPNEDILQEFMERQGG